MINNLGDALDLGTRVIEVNKADKSLMSISLTVAPRKKIKKIKQK